MDENKFTALWVSHSSISDFLNCPRLYFLKNVYKSPKTGRKMQIITPSLALGQAVHRVVESLSVLPVEKRFDTPLFDKFNKEWEKVSGKKGGFISESQEEHFRKRGEEMLKRVIKNPGPLKRLAVKIKEDLPHFWISKEENIILCGKIDWLEYFPETKGVHIIDFKTSKKRENEESLQLPIYHLLAQNCQSRSVDKASYWYLEVSDALEEKTLPSIDEAKEKVMKIARTIKVHRKLEKLDCKEGNGCRFCQPFEKILKGEAELVGKDESRDLFVLKSFPEEEESYII